MVAIINISASIFVVTNGEIGGYLNVYDNNLNTIFDIPNIHTSNYNGNINSNNISFNLNNQTFSLHALDGQALSLYALSVLLSDGKHTVPMNCSRPQQDRNIMYCESHQ